MMNELANSTVVYKSSLLKKPEISLFSAGEVAAFSFPSSNIAEDNQDSAILIPLNHHELVLGLSDGAGGQLGGQQASQIVINELKKELLHDSNEDQIIRASILNAIEFANKSVMELKTGAGATACIVSIEENRCRPFHVGDSVIAITGQRGKLIYRNTEHSPLGYALRSELVTEEHLDSEISHEVFHLVGNTDMHIEIGPEIELKKSDTLFMCSDGITDLIPLDECLKLIKSGPLKKAANLLSNKFFKIAENLDHKDDATFIVFRSAG